jgi:hypothetical protein
VPSEFPRTDNDAACARKVAVAFDLMKRQARYIDQRYPHIEAVFVFEDRLDAYPATFSGRDHFGRPLTDDGALHPGRNGCLAASPLAMRLLTPSRPSTRHEKITVELDPSNCAPFRNRTA